MITDTGNELNKAHIKYLESRLVETAIEAGQIRLENGIAPTRSSLSEAATANMEGFLDTILLILPALKIDQFSKTPEPKNFGQSALSDRHEIAPIFEIKGLKGFDTPPDQNVFQIWSTLFLISPVIITIDVRCF